MTKEVILLGGADSMNLCPYDCAEIWTVNNLYKKVKKLTKLFIIHNQVYEAGGLPHYDWIDMNLASIKDNFEIWSTHRINMLQSKRYPMPEIVLKYNTTYFTSSICYMLAFALYRDFQKLRLYGIDMTDPKYYSDRPGVEFWLGQAKGQGCQIEISAGSALLRQSNVER